MNRALIGKVVGVALVLSGLILLALKLVSLPETREGWDAWASPESGTYWFIGALALEVVLLVARLALGYLAYLGKEIVAWVFYPLVILIAVSGPSGMVLVAILIALRFWPGGSDADKT